MNLLSVDVESNKGRDRIMSLSKGDKKEVRKERERESRISFTKIWYPSQHTLTTYTQPVASEDPTHTERLHSPYFM